MKDIFGEEIIDKPIHVNIYADEIQGKKCPITNCLWDYIGIIVENTDSSLLDDVINERFMRNLDQTSPYYEKNNGLIHWSEIRTIDKKNVCNRWLNYILDPSKSCKKYYSYILGLNNSFLIKEEFDQSDEFNSIYNRFFRSAVLYALKTFYNDHTIVVENIFHEEGQQQHHEFFPWHIIYKLGKEDNISFSCDKIIFLPKDHRKDKRSNIIQLCDCVLGVSTCLIHGIENSKVAHYREELAEMYLPLLERIMNYPFNKKSSYQYYNRIMIRFFPKEKTKLGDLQRDNNQFYYKRELYYNTQRSGQGSLF